MLVRLHFVAYTPMSVSVPGYSNLHRQLPSRSDLKPFPSVSCTGNRPNTKEEVVSRQFPQRVIRDPHMSRDGSSRPCLRGSSQVSKSGTEKGILRPRVPVEGPWGNSLTSLPEPVHTGGLRSLRKGRDPHRSLDLVPLGRGRTNVW